MLFAFRTTNLPYTNIHLNFSVALNINNFLLRRSWVPSNEENALEKFCINCVAGAGEHMHCWESRWVNWRDRRQFLWFTRWVNQIIHSPTTTRNFLHGNCVYYVLDVVFNGLLSKHIYGWNMKSIVEAHWRMDVKYGLTSNMRSFALYYLTRVFFLFYFFFRVKRRKNKTN